MDGGRSPGCQGLHPPHTAPDGRTARGHSQRPRLDAARRRVGPRHPVDPVGLGSKHHGGDWRTGDPSKTLLGAPRTPL